MSRSRPYLRNMPACLPSSGIAPSQLPRMGEAILSVSAASPCGIAHETMTASNADNPRMLMPISDRWSPACRPQAGGGVLAALGLEVDIHFHPDRERIRLRQVDQNLDHIDVGYVALSPRVDAPLFDERRDESDLAREFASAKRGGTHQDRLPDLNLPEIALIQFRAHAQRGDITDDQQRLRIGGSGQFTRPGIDLQHRAGDGRADRQLCN